MGKFKVGDEVIVKKCCDSCYGRIFTIDHIDEDGDYYPRQGYGTGDMCSCYTDAEIELYRPAIKPRQASTFFHDHKFKVGDRVRVKRGLSIGKVYGNNVVNSRMAKCGGQIMTIRGVNSDGTCHLKEDPGDWYWTDEMLEPVKDEQVAYGDIADYPGAVPTYHSGYDIMGEYRQKWAHQWASFGNHAARLATNDNNNLGERIMETLRTIPKRLKKVLDKDYKAMYQLNWLNGDLERTSKGTEELMDFLIDKYKDDLGALARERVKEIEDENES